MRLRWARRRRPATRGFVLAEALVSLTVAALTLALLTSATWGLRQTAMQPDPLQQEAADWLTARRALQAWAGSATTDGPEGPSERFTGSPVQMRLIVDDGTSRSTRPVMISLDIAQTDGRYQLTAARQFDVRDVRLGMDRARASTLIVSDQPLRLVYLVAARRAGGERVWTYDPRPAQGLPAAIAVERAAERMIVAQMPATLSAVCVSRGGVGALRSSECELR